jgi:hypothetical protein
LLHSTFDAQGRCVSRPMLDSELWEIGKRARKEPCIHCNQPLGEQPPKEIPAIDLTSPNREVYLHS